MEYHFVQTKRMDGKVTIVKLFFERFETFILRIFDLVFFIQFQKFLLQTRF